MDVFFFFIRLETKVSTKTLTLNQTIVSKRASLVFLRCSIHLHSYLKYRLHGRAIRSHGTKSQYRLHGRAIRSHGTKSHSLAGTQAVQRDYPAKQREDQLCNMRPSKCDFVLCGMTRSCQGPIRGQAFHYKNDQRV